MNKFLLIAVAFLAVISLVRCDEDSSEEFLEHVKSEHFKKILKDKKESAYSGWPPLEARCPGITQKLKNPLKAFARCKNAIDDSLPVCTVIRNHALNCTQPILTVLSDCLDKEDVGILALVAKSLVSAVDYLCKLDGETIFELFHPCVLESYFGYFTVEMKECVKRVFAKYENKKGIPSLHDVCSVATDFTACVKEDIETSCKNEKPKTVSFGLFDALMHPCSTVLVNN